MAAGRMAHRPERRRSATRATVHDPQGWGTRWLGYHWPPRPDGTTSGDRSQSLDRLREVGQVDSTRGCDPVQGGKKDLVNTTLEPHSRVRREHIAGLVQRLVAGRVDLSDMPVERA